MSGEIIKRKMGFGLPLTGEVQVKQDDEWKRVVVAEEHPAGFVVRDRRQRTIKTEDE